MFGYVKTERGQLRVCEYEYYRALYCGLCHRMGKCTGQCSRMTLSYDFVFLAATRLALTGEQTTVKKQRCFVHPLKKRWTVQRCEALDFCADAAALLCYHKLADDVSDERGFARLRARIARLIFRRGFQKARKRYGELADRIAVHLQALSAEEGRESALGGGVEQIAAHFGALLSDVLAFGLPEERARIGAAIGRAVGHWIYLTDAADDLLQDRKKGRFNPYLRGYGGVPDADAIEGIRTALTAHLCDAERAIALIDGYPHAEVREIIANILYLGMPHVARDVTNKLKGEGK